MGVFDLFAKRNMDEGVEEFRRTPQAVLLDVRTAEEYREAVEFMEQLGLTQGFLQEGGAVGESFIPSFSLEGLERYCQK